MNCKLVGQFVQHLEVTLSPGENFYAEKGSVIYLEAGIEKNLASMAPDLGESSEQSFLENRCLYYAFTTSPTCPAKSLSVVGSVFFL